jgi:hypothetical protein
MPPGGPGGSDSGTLLDEMKEKGSLMTGDYAVQFRKVLEKTYGNINQAMTVTLNPMDTMALMSGQIQSMMIKDKHPFETASTFNLTSMPKVPQHESVVNSMLTHGQNTLLAQNQLVKFMQDLLTSTYGGKDPKAEGQGAESPPGTTPPQTEGKSGTSPPGSSPPGTLPPGTSPPGSSPPGTLPPGTLPGGENGG